MTVRLVVKSGARAGLAVNMTGEAMLVGRDPDCTLQLDPVADTGVSRRHALIRREPAGLRLRDLNSANGTFLNGARIQEAWLQPGDRLRLGRQGPELWVEGDAPPPVPAPPAEPRRPMDELTLLPVARDTYGQYHALRVGLALGVTVVSGAFALLVVLMSGFGLGLGAALVGVVVAFVPAPFYLGIWLWMDRYDPEPVWLLVACLAWGGGVATFVSGLVNVLSMAVVEAASGDEALGRLVAASVSAPLVEEISKCLPVLFIFLFLRREFDGVLDGIVYAGVVALGFATVENVEYYGRNYAESGVPGLTATFLIRGVLDPFGHAVYTAMFGIGCGIARETHRPAWRWLAPMLGFVAAVFLHFLWNTVAGLFGLLGVAISYLLVWVPLFAAFLGLVIFASRREARLIRRLLAGEVETGLLTREQYEVVGSYSRRLRWLMAAMGDRRRLAARRRFVATATRLALSYWHAERARLAGGQTVSLGQIPLFRRKLEELADRV